MIDCYQECKVNLTTCQVTLSKCLGAFPGCFIDVTLYVDGASVRVRGVSMRPSPMIFSLDETTDLGSDTATSVTDDLTSAETRFTGRVH